MEKQRKGGLKIDPDVKAWQKNAATNKAALTKKQRRDGARVRVKYDLPPELKAAIEVAAKDYGTSASQFAGWLLLWAIMKCNERPPMTASHSPFFDYDVVLPVEWLDALQSVDEAGTQAGTQAGT